MKIIVFDTFQEAQECLNAINALATNWWISKGYTVINGELISKKGNQDAPQSAKVTTWDTIKTSPTNKYFILSLTDVNPEWSDWKQTLADDLSFTAIGTEIEYPESWIVNDGV